MGSHSGSRICKHTHTHLFVFATQILYVCKPLPNSCRGESFFSSCTQQSGGFGACFDMKSLICRGIPEEGKPTWNQTDRQTDRKLTALSLVLFPQPRKAFECKSLSKRLKSHYYSHRRNRIKRLALTICCELKLNSLQYWQKQFCLIPLPIVLYSAWQ